MSGTNTASRVVLVDAGGTNIGSVRYALQRLGVAAPLSTDPAVIRNATHVILPGVGAAAPGMQRLHQLGLVDTLRNLRQPVLGVCLGMQLLFASSQEGETECLGVLPGRVRQLVPQPGVRIPHMGWNRLQLRRASALTANVVDGDYAYFVHSYAAPSGDYTVAACRHGEEFSAVVSQANFHGMQFHPERSSTLGARLLQNFLALS